MTDPTKDAERLAEIRSWYGTIRRDPIPDAANIAVPFLLAELDERDATIARLTQERDTARAAARCIPRGSPAMSETQATINQWQAEQFPDATEEGILKHLREEFNEFLASTDTMVEAADLVILLYAWAGKVGGDLHAAIDAKMGINRARRWKIQPDGTGRHVR